MIATTWVYNCYHNCLFTPKLYISPTTAALMTTVGRSSFIIIIILCTSFQSSFHSIKNQCFMQRHCISMSQTHLKSLKFLNSIMPMLPYISTLPFQWLRRKYHQWRLNWVVTLNLRWWCTFLSIIILWASSRMAFQFYYLACMHG